MDGSVLRASPCQKIRPNASKCATPARWCTPRTINASDDVSSYCHVSFVPASVVQHSPADSSTNGVRVLRKRSAGKLKTHRCNNRKRQKTGVWSLVVKNLSRPFMLGFEGPYINDNLGGGFKYFLFSPLFGEDEPILTHIISDGLVQPPTTWWCKLLFCGAVNSSRKRGHELANPGIWILPRFM